MAGRRHPKSAAQLIAEAARDAAILTTRCLFCDETFTGTAVEGRDWHRRHRFEAHRNKARKRTVRQGAKYRWIEKPSDEQIAQARRDRAEREQREQLETILRGRARRAAEEAA